MGQIELINNTIVTANKKQVFLIFSTLQFLKQLESVVSLEMAKVLTSLKYAQLFPNDFSLTRIMLRAEKAGA